MKEVTVAVTGAGSLVGQGIIKCLRRSGLAVRILGLDYFDTATGLKWCDSRGILPDILSPEIREDAWFDALCERVAAARCAVLFPGLDFELVPIAARREALRARTGCIAAISPIRTVETCRDKYRTACWLREAGFAAPRSFLPTADPDTLEATLGFPMLVKPRTGSRSRGVRRVDDRAALSRALAETADPFIQQYLPGDEGEFTCGVVVLDGRVDTVAVLRRRLKDGNTIFAEAVDRPEIDSHCREIGRRLGAEGPVNIQLRLVDGVPYVFEINPRFSGTTVFRALLGINEPERVLLHLLGRDVGPPPRLRSGRVTRYFEEMVEPADGGAPVADVRRQGTR